MSQFAAEIAKALTVAAIQAQPKVFDQDAKSSLDASRLGKEVAEVFKAIFAEIVNKVPSSDPNKKDQPT